MINSFRRNPTGVRFDNITCVTSRARASINCEPRDARRTSTRYSIYRFRIVKYSSAYGRAELLRFRQPINPRCAAQKPHNEFRIGFDRFAIIHCIQHSARDVATRQAVVSHNRADVQRQPLQEASRRFCYGCHSTFALWAWSRLERSSSAPMRRIKKMFAKKHVKYHLFYRTDQPRSGQVQSSRWGWQILYCFLFFTISSTHFDCTSISIGREGRPLKSRAFRRMAFAEELHRLHVVDVTSWRFWGNAPMSPYGTFPS